MSSPLPAAARVLPALALLALAPAAAAQPADPSGRYTVAGRAEGAAEPYSGRAVIAAGESGWTLRLEREDLGTERAVLPPVGPGGELSAPVGGAGVEGALTGEAGEALTLEVRYRPAPEGLAGRWRLLRDGEAVARGRETLRRRDVEAPRVRVAVSVDWEGRVMSERDIRAMERFREDAPGVPLTHFINAAYFTKADADPERLAATMRRVVLEEDEAGLHVHAWRSLIEASGVSFRTHPTFWGGSHGLNTSGADVGHEVEIAAYTVDELRDVLATSRRILADHGFPLSASFRAGGWMAAPNVLEAIRAEGFTVDSSATDPVWHEELEGYRLRDRIDEVWPDVDPDTQPYYVETPAGRVLEMPDTCALADYVTAGEMVEHIREAIARFEAAGAERDVFVHIGFHQETAARYAGRVSRAIGIVRERWPDAPVVFETLEDSARRARAALGD